MEKFIKNFHQSITQLGIEKEIENAHYIDIIIRINGEDRRYQFDCVKTLLKAIREAFTKANKG